MAATNRIISYAKGFLQNSKEVQVICFRKTENQNDTINKEIKGLFEGVSFMYLFRETFRSKSFFGRRFDVLSGYSNLFFFALKNNTKSTLSIYYSSYSLPALILFLVKNLKGSVLLKEESEHPEVYIKEKTGLSKFVFKNLHFKLFSGYLLMTNNLMQLFKGLNSKKKPMLLVPMTVDADRFLHLVKNGNEKCIVYTGSINYQKDGLDILIKAFEHVLVKHPEYELGLFGSAPSESELLKLKKLVNDLKLTNKVIFYGQVNREIISQKILNANILVLPRPDSVQAQNGFPTKLGEYLATGNPVIATSVGEIPLYLTHKVDSFLVEAGNINDLSEKINTVIENYDEALIIANRGKELAKKTFNNIIQTSNIIKFSEENFEKIN